MRAWWTSRTRREQILLGVMLAVAGILVVWLAIVAPLNAALQRAEERYAQAAAVDAAVARNVAAIGRLKGPPPPASASRPLDAVVNETAAAAGVELGRVEADPAGGLRVAAPSVAPTVLFPWLGLLQREHGVVADHLTVVKNDTGAVEIDATLKRAAQ